MRATRVVAGALATVLVAGALLLSALRLVDTAARWPAMLASFAAYGLVGFVAYLVLATLLFRGTGARARSWLVGGVVVCLVGSLVQVAWNLPLFRGDGARRADLTVMTANLQFGNADAAAVVRAARRSGAAVLVLEEVTFGEQPRLEQAGLRRTFGYVTGLPDQSAAGTLIYSRYPLSGQRRLGISNGGVAARVEAPRPFELLAVHPGQPRNSPANWQHDLATIRTLARAAVRSGPTLVVGDFNATRDHVAFRRVLGAGLADAAEQAGSGWQPTWPESIPISGPGGTVRGTWLRPLIAIDHVLLSHQFRAVSTSTVQLPGSDHRALVARLDTRGLPG
ncbi:endonuclease/exonuclease/phosphatase family protein [Nocardioides mangrovicus]|uniref:Endonuclease/exonuclease/phosphatase family protein n=1 Tax=Nocardioides mangrovicus TaxID=2478913 RepID=A0A3L8P7G4_9ACTN|nr:endonuclease/exonuclease/phosphatase family protein [Nocardioides mangrovicus]RLV51084.1 endonuclease/exonuclease/phosphatase family protein [Nocardioides mangrovicus]